MGRRSGCRRRPVVALTARGGPRSVFLPRRCHGGVVILRGREPFGARGNDGRGRGRRNRGGFGAGLSFHVAVSSGNVTLLWPSPAGGGMDGWVDKAGGQAKGGPEWSVGTAISKSGGRVHPLQVVYAPNPEMEGLTQGLTRGLEVPITVFHEDG